MTMNKNVLIRHARDPLFGFTSEGLVSFLQEALRGRAINAYTFGSFGTPDFNRHSDIDLIIVCNTQTRFVERGAAFADLRERVPSLEILVYTPEEFTSLTTEPTAGFWRTVTSTMRKVM